MLLPYANATRAAPENPLCQWCMAAARKAWGPAVCFTSARPQA